MQGVSIIWDIAGDAHDSWCNKSSWDCGVSHDEPELESVIFVDIDGVGES